ncbi:hypothetical protein ACNKHV_02500 [Shigella flexneri]
MPDYSRRSPDSVDHAAQHRANCYGRSAKNWQICGWCLACAGRYGENGIAVRHFGMPEQQTSHWRRQIVRISLALLPIHFWSVVAEFSPLHLMDDVLGKR